MSHHLDDSLLLQHRLLAVLVVLSKSQLRIDGVVREAQRCNGEKHWLVARHTQVHTSGGRPPRVKARGVQFGMVPPTAAPHCRRNIAFSGRIPLPRRVAEWSTNSGTPSLDQQGLACAIYALALFGQLGGRESSHTCQALPENGSYFQIIDFVFHIGHVVCASVHTNTRRKRGCGVMQHSALIHAVRLVCLGSPSISAHCMVQTPYRWPHLNSMLGRTVPEDACH